MGSSVIIKCFFLDRQSKKVLPKGMLHTVDLLSINRLDQLLFILKMYTFTKRHIDRVFINVPDKP
jgi:hypothetical protein